MVNYSLLLFTALSLAAHAALISLWPATDQALLHRQETTIEIGLVSLPRVTTDFTRERNRPSKLPSSNMKLNTTQEPIIDSTQPPKDSIHQHNPIQTPKLTTKSATAMSTITKMDEETSLTATPSSSPQPENSPMLTTKAAPLQANNKAPNYPTAALRSGWGGEVWLKVAISSSGAVNEIIIEQSSDYLILDQAAVKAVYDWQFEPARVGEEPTESSIRIPIRFKIKRS